MLYTLSPGPKQLINEDQQKDQANIHIKHQSIGVQKIGDNR